MPDGTTSTSSSPAARTLGELRATGHEHRPVKTEVRENLLAAMRAGRPRFPGIVGFDETVLPALERALLAGHDVVLLGERGQGKTRLIRTLVVAARRVDARSSTAARSTTTPRCPVCARCRRLHAELGDELPVGWKHRSERYGEKLATPDTSVGDLIGDIDPVKVAEGRTLGDPETVHYGLVPRTNRGIFAINELPDLAERIQVSLLNVLEERDIQVRGYALRLPLDLLLVASANPEDYTNRGRIITPLKDRFGAEIRTHYPDLLDDEIDVIRQEADARGHRARTSCSRSSPGSPATSASRRPSTPGPASPRGSASPRPRPRRRRRCGAARSPARTPRWRASATCRPSCRALLGKVEFEVDEEGREVEVLAPPAAPGDGRDVPPPPRRLRPARADREVRRGPASSRAATWCPAGGCSSRSGRCPGWRNVLELLGVDEGAETPELAAAALEFALEGSVPQPAHHQGRQPDGGDHVIYGAA